MLELEPVDGDVVGPLDERPVRVLRLVRPRPRHDRPAPREPRARGREVAPVGGDRVPRALARRRVVPPRAGHDRLGALGLREADLLGHEGVRLAPRLGVRLRVPRVRNLVRPRRRELHVSGGDCWLGRVRGRRLAEPAAGGREVGRLLAPQPREAGVGVRLGLVRPRPRRVVRRQVEVARRALGAGEALRRRAEDAVAAHHLLAQVVREGVLVALVVRPRARHRNFRLVSLEPAAG
mmetsp:Transcript_6322/g.22234  ORF Transcript_6322/g.22234 Transcript_6322/m.22234 type:complete len:236 (+) Transcript_6322:539-1246(+)